ncbi:AAA family ATPase [Streptomyces sp. NPDC021212]|uniref:AAA family ATPase n=1 Tax=Streptomyces sp. NPDC021212 TaxID=3365118 RepID=UPI0037BD54A4
MHGQGTYATTRGTLPARQERTPSPRPDGTVRPDRDAAVHDLRGGVGAELRYPARDLIIASGLPGSGKSTLINRVVPGTDPSGAAVVRVDSQHTRDAWERRMPRWLPYGVYRPLVRCAHYVGLRRAVTSGASVVVHDCGSQPWVRRWLARDARRTGRRLHLVLLDVDPAVALEGQAARGRGVTGFAFGRHRRAMGRLVARVEGGRPPEGCASAVLLDRATASVLRGISFE